MPRKAATPAKPATQEKAEALQEEAGYVYFMFKGNGGTRGKEDNVQYSWKDGHVVRAPEGNFDHLGGGDCEIVSEAEFEAFMSLQAKTETRKVKQNTR